MPIEDRGFASMDPERRRDIASRGGRAAHMKGTAHEWTREEAREAGHKGGLVHQRRRRASLGEGLALPVDPSIDAPIAMINREDLRIDHSE